MIEMEVFGISDRGLVRDANEDCFAVGGFVQSSGSLNLISRSDSTPDLGRGLLVAIADGMGGRSGGEVASRYAAEAVARASVHVEPRDGPDAVAAVFEQAIARAHAGLAEYEGRHPASAGLGTTLTGLCFVPGRLIVFHVGDSRAYRYRDSYLDQLTVDHTAGEQRGLTGIGKTMLTNSVGGGVGADCQPDLETSVVPKSGDVYLLCSDGLTDVVDAAAIKAALATPARLSDCAAALIDRVYSAGAPDNVTVVLVRVESVSDTDL